MPAKTDVEDEVQGGVTVEEIRDIANIVHGALDGEDELDDGTIYSYINQVLPEVIHNDTVAYQKTHGWTVGAPDDEFNEKDRIDPNLVPYGSTNPGQRVRDAAVYAVVQALVPYIVSEKNDIPASIQNQTPKQREEWEEENETKLKEVDGKLTVVEDHRGVQASTDSKVKDDKPSASSPKNDDKVPSVS